jgi:hypothetical protein
MRGARAGWLENPPHGFDQMVKDDFAELRLMLPPDRQGLPPPMRTRRIPAMTNSPKLVCLAILFTLRLT